MPWQLNGNNGTNPSRDFLGTSDNQPLAIRTNGVERVRINVNGNVRIGAGAPSSRLTVGVPSSGAAISALSVDVDSFQTPSNALASHFFRVRDIQAAPPNGVTHFYIRGDGNVGVGTQEPAARLSIVAPQAPNLVGAALSSTLTTSAGRLGTAAGNELPLASIGFTAQNSISLGVRAFRTASGDGWPRTSIGLGMDVDNTVRAGASLWLNAFGNVGIGTPRPQARLAVAAGPSPDPIAGLTIDVESFQTPSNAARSYFLRVRDIQAAPPDGVTHFYIRGDGNVGLGTITPQARLHVNGDVIVTGDVRLEGADYAEEFDIADSEAPAPGTVMVLDDLGAVRVCDRAYDKRVVGVVSGAGGHEPAIILDRRDTGCVRRPLALLGKVYCKVDASNGEVAVGDLLATSPTPGYAMKAAEVERCSGAILGKALAPLRHSQGLIPVLVTLQ